MLQIHNVGVLSLQNWMPLAIIRLRGEYRLVLSLHRNAVASADRDARIILFLRRQLKRLNRRHFVWNWRAASEEVALVSKIEFLPIFYVS